MSKGLYKQFASDKQVEKDGVWLEYGMNSHDQPIRIRVARAGGGNVRYTKAFEVHSKPFRRLIQTGNMDDESSRRMMTKVYVDAVIRDWEGVEDRDGNPLEFSRENVEQVLTDLPDLFADIIQQSQNSQLYREEILEADAGN